MSSRARQTARTARWSVGRALFGVLFWLPLLLAACSGPAKVTKPPSSRPVVRPKPKPKPVPTPFQRAAAQIERAERQQETLRQLWRLDALWTERLSKAIDKAVNEGVENAELRRVLRQCYGERSGMVPAPAPFLPRTAPKGGRDRWLQAGGKLIEQLQRGLSTCSPRTRLTVTTAHSGKLAALRIALSLTDELRVLLKLDRTRRGRDVEQWAKTTKALENELLRFEKSVILPTFKDPDSTKDVRRIARKKLSEVRRLRRRLRAVARHLQRDWSVHRRRTEQFSRRIEKLLAARDR